MIWAVVASTLTVSAVVFGGPSSSFMYGIDDSSQLWVMGLSGTNGGTSQLLIGSTLTGSAANGLAYDRAREQLFVADTTTSELFWWKQGATNFTSLGSISAYTAGSVGQPQSAAYYKDAYWFFGGGSQGNQITKLSLNYSGVVPTIASGTTFVIGGTMPTSESGGGDMVITSSGTLYAYSRPAIGRFFTADLENILSGTVGGYSLISTGTVGLQLALSADDTTLYGHNFADGSWYNVDTSNGNTTQVPGFTTVGFRDLGGSSVQAVPEPNTLVLAALGGGMLAWQAVRRRKRRGSGPGEVREPTDQSPHDRLDELV